MSNIYEYIKNNNKSFREDKLNDIDKVILSLIPYIDFTDIVFDEPISFKDAISKFIIIKDKKEFAKKAVFDKDIYKMVEHLNNSDRYKDILILNYIVKNNNEEQFSAITMQLPDNTLFIGYEGTDTLLSGWKEDFEMSYKYPIPAQADAIEYANRSIKITDFKVILGGHSKGGNLALVAAMNLSLIDRMRVKEIISVDGPGLKTEEYNSKEYQRIKPKYRHIIPNYSFVGQLLNNDNNEIVKSNRIDIYSHSPLEWELIDNKFLSAELSSFSTKINNKIDKWLEKHTYEERRKTIEDLFNIFDNLHIKDLHALSNPVNLIRIIKASKHLDETTKDILKSFIGG